MTKTSKLMSVFLISIFYAATVLAQTQPADPKPADSPTAQTKAIDLGQLDGNKYVNDSFGLSLTTPRDWVVVTAQTRPQFKDEVKNLVLSEDQAKQSQVRASIDRSAVLLSLTKLPAGQPNNAGLMLIAERIPTPAIKDGRDVIQSMKRTMTGTNFNVEFQGDVTVEQVNGAEFGAVTIKNSSQFGVFLQKIYVTVKDGFALQLFFTYTDSSDLPAFDAVIKSAKIK